MYHPFYLPTKIPYLNESCIIKSKVTLFNFKVNRTRQNSAFDLSQKGGTAIPDTIMLEYLFQLIRIFLIIFQEMTAKDQLKSMYVKLNQWNDFLGGEKTKNPNKKDSEFDYIKNQFLEKRYATDKLFEQKEQTTKASELGTLAFEIRKHMDNCKQLLEKLEAEQRRVAASKNKVSQEQLERQQKILANCQALYNDLLQRSKSNTGRQPRQNIQTLTELKTKLLKEIDIESHRIEKMGSEDSFFQTDEPNEQEKQALEQFEMNDKVIDDRLGGVVNRIDGLKQQVKNIGAANDVIHKKVVKNNEAVGRVTKNIKTQNQKLKVIIEKFKPTNCCLTIVFILLLIGLIVVVINMALNK